jgi:mono/diheme cytochrome c family protein
MGSWAHPVSGLNGYELDSITRILKGAVLPPVQSLITMEEGNPEKGNQLFTSYCATCHGEKGNGGVAVALNQDGFLKRATNPFILETILRGRGNTAMPGWSHLDPLELSHLVSTIRSWSPESPSGVNLVLPEADEKDGALKYHFLCSRCHGEFGEGETGPAVINRDFLKAANTRYLYETIAMGREHTAMFGWSADVYNQEQLGIQDISNIIGFMRKTAQLPLVYVYQGSNPGSRDRGAAIFTERCAECHGNEGEGTEAPALNNQEFLSAASNGYLMATVTLGRKGTAMPSWGYGQHEYPALSAKEREDLVALIRSWQRIRIRY